MKKILFSFLSLAIAGCLQAQTKYYVAPGATGSGSSWFDSGDFQTLITDASAGDSVFVKVGTYQPASGFSYNMVEGVKIYGGFLGTETSLSQRTLKANLAKGDSSILEGNGNSVINNTFASTGPMTSATILDGFTITGGNAGVSGGGGGIYDKYASPTLSNLVIRNNTAQFGGGVFNVFSSPTLTDVIIRGNSAGANGGGMSNGSSSNVALTNVLISGNRANSGGGIFNNSASSPTLINVTISGNTSNTNGGGITNNVYTCIPIITNSIIYGNVASARNGIFNNGNFSPKISYCLVQDSTSTANGNVNSTGIAATDIFASPQDASNAPTATGDYTLKTGSPAIDMGDNTKVSGISLDLAGNARIYNTTVDLGPYENQGVALPVTLINYSGVLRNGIADLKWQTGVETNFNHFEIEQSEDAKTFNTLASISAKGNNSSYTYSVAQAAATTYYRLKMVDNDGHSKYSNVVSLSQSQVAESVILYPNPAKDYINVKVAASGDLHIYDESGRLIINQMVQTGIAKINVSNLSSGVYYVILNGQKMSFMKHN